MPYLALDSATHHGRGVRVGVATRRLTACGVPFASLHFLIFLKKRERKREEGGRSGRV